MGASFETGLVGGKMTNDYPRLILEELQKISSLLEVRKRKPKAKTESQFDLESVYKLYPRKEGKVAGLASLAANIKTPEDFKALTTAVKSYAFLVKTEKREKQYILLFSTFCNGRWKDYIPGTAHPVPANVDIRDFRLL